jgi:hypothetical protein
VLGPDERISARDALTLWSGTADEPTTPRTIAPGQPGDLCLLGAVPADALTTLDSSLVTATIIGGAVVFDRG